MKIYIGGDFKCHTTNDGTMQEIETDSFDGKCKFYIEGFRYVPEGSTWTREDGEVFTGIMIAPWRDYALLETVQAEFEDMQSALNAIYEGEVE